MKDLEQKWQNERDDFEGVGDFINSHTSKLKAFLQLLKQVLKIHTHIFAEDHII
jgi:hypothetical protein